MLIKTVEALEDALYDVPWNRGEWTGNFISADSVATCDFVREDISEVLAYGSTNATDWDGETAGVIRLKDGRVVAWESDWGPTGRGFNCDAYGGDADIVFANTVEAALSHISEKARELLIWE